MACGGFLQLFLDSGTVGISITTNASISSSQWAFSFPAEQMAGRSSLAAGQRRLRPVAGAASDRRCQRHRPRSANAGPRSIGVCLLSASDTDQRYSYCCSRRYDHRTPPRRPRLVRSLGTTGRPRRHSFRIIIFYQSGASPGASEGCSQQ